MSIMEKRLKAAKKYLSQRGISAVAMDSKFRYRNAAGKEIAPPEWIRKEDRLIVVDDAVKKKA
jgi:hypothetical protein